MIGFEPTASCSQSRRSSQAELHPVKGFNIEYLILNIKAVAAFNNPPEIHPFRKQLILSIQHSIVNPKKAFPGKGETGSSGSQGLVVWVRFGLQVRMD